MLKREKSVGFSSGDDSDLSSDHDNPFNEIVLKAKDLNCLH